MIEVAKSYLTSWPAMIMTAVVIIVVFILFKFPKEIRRKIKSLSSVGGNKGANWEKEKGTLPENGVGKIKEEYEKADEIILGLRSQNDELLKIAQGLNTELEDAKIMLFFERVARAMVAWQYFLLKIGCENEPKQIKVEEAVLKIKEAYPEFEQYVNDDVLIATLEDLQSLNFVKAIRPYTKDTPLEFTDLTVSFLAYLNSGNLTT